MVAHFLADYCDSQSGWRFMKGEEYPEDRRNLRCADALEGFADYLRTLPEDDSSRGLGLDTGTGCFDPANEETHGVISRFCFDNETGKPGRPDFQRLLDEIAALERERESD